MATLNKKEEQLLSLFLLSMDYFRRDPSLQSTVIRAANGHSYQIHKQFALKFLRWKFHRFFLDPQFSDDKYLINYLSTKENQQRLFNLIPNHETRGVDDKDLDKLEAVLQSDPKLQEAQINAFVNGKNTQGSNSGLLRQKPAILINRAQENLKTGEKPESMESEKELKQTAQTPSQQTMESSVKAAGTQNQTAPFQQQPQPASTSKGFNMPNIPPEFTSSAKNAASSAGVFFKRNTGKYLTTQRLATVASSIIGGITGAGLTGGSPIGVFAGAAAGGALPSFINSGAAGPMLSKIGNGAMDRVESLGNLGQSASNFSSNLRSRAGNIRSNVLSPKRGGLRFAGMFLGFFLLFFGLGLFTSTLPGGSPDVAADPLNPGTASDISSCQFTRGDRNPTSQIYQSPLLLSYFKQAEALTSVPAVVLASIARVESPTVTSRTDDNLSSLDSLAGCPRSPTGALGIMQIQPTGTRGSFGAGLEKGASYLNTTADQLTEADYCDIKKSIILSAGFILKKLQLGYGIGDGVSWDPAWNNDKNVIYKVASGYYGCLEYGGGDPLKCTGPYNYGEDIWTSIQACKPTSNVGIGPIPQEKLDKIVYWAGSIYEVLQRGLPPTSYNRMLQTITNGTYTATTRSAQDMGVGPTGIYWCTNLVIDSYNLSSITGLGPQHQGVRGMLDFWKNAGGDYTFIPFDGINSLRQAKAGHVVFRLYPSDYKFDHVSIIKSIDIDQRGNGKIVQYDSNGVRNWSSTIEDGKILDTFFLPGIVGFGGVR